MIDVQMSVCECNYVTLPDGQKSCQMLLKVLSLLKEMVVLEALSKSTSLEVNFIFNMQTAKSNTSNVSGGKQAVTFFK